MKINDKHFEVVVRQMMRKVRILDPGDSIFLENQLIFSYDFTTENDSLFGMKIVEEVGDSENFKQGQIITSRQLRDENSLLKRENKSQVLVREVLPQLQNLNFKVLPGLCKQNHLFLQHLFKKQQKY